MKCSYCGKEYQVGTGFALFKKDGSTVRYCSNKCFTNLKHRKTTLWIKKSKKASKANK